MSAFAKAADANAWLRHTTMLLLAASVAQSCRPAGVTSRAAAMTAEQEKARVLSRLRWPVRIAGRAPELMTLQQRMRDYGVSAVSVTVVRGNRVRWTAVVGTRAIGTADSITNETLFQAASISKPLVATAVLRMVESGALSLDRPANDLLRSWKIPENQFTASSPVLLRHLLSHTAGATNGAVGIYAPGVPVPTLLQALDGVAPSNRPPIRIDAVPGTRWRYAGGGYSIVQQLLIDQTGTPFPDLMRRLVLDPLGMSHSCFCQPLPPTLEANAAVGHDASGAPIKGKWWTLPEMAAGGLWTTGADLSRFVIAINEAWSNGRPGFMQRETTRRMLQPVRAAWSLGFNVDSIGDTVRVSHTGSNNGYRSVFVTYPQTGDAIVILTNGDGGANLREEILRSAAAVYGWAGYAQTERSIATSGRTLGEYAGAYRYDARFSSTFELSGDTLVARLNGGAPSMLYVEAPDRFFTLTGTSYQFVRAIDAPGASGSTVTGVVVRFSDGTELKGRREVRSP